MSWREKMKKIQNNRNLRMAVEQELADSNLPPPNDETSTLRREPDMLPPRDDVKKRYKKEDIKKEDRADYGDTLFDPDLKSNN